MKTVLITGSGGLIGSTAAEFYLNKGFKVVGIDNNMREFFFGEGGSVVDTIDHLKHNENYEHHYIDIRNRTHLEKLFTRIADLHAIIHTAAQPSHDKASHFPIVDFEVNALGTLNLLELTREHAVDVPFVFTSTNKVYGDAPNKLDFVAHGSAEDPKRIKFQKWNLSQNGIDESMSIDQCLHSVFGASKAAADIMVQEYGKYFGMKTVCFRGGCLTGKQHKSVELHGFLSYIVKCAKEGKKYTIFGYGGRQVRDQIHSYDCITAFDEFINAPGFGEVYNLGGGKENSASILEIIDILKNDYDLKLEYEYVDSPRIGDHMCYYTDMSKFREHYPNWKKKYSLSMILDEMINQ